MQTQSPTPTNTATATTASMSSVFEPYVTANTQDAVDLTRAIHSAHLFSGLPLQVLVTTIAYLQATAAQVIEGVDDLNGQLTLQHRGAYLSIRLAYPVQEHCAEAKPPALDNLNCRVTYGVSSVYEVVAEIDYPPSKQETY